MCVPATVQKEVQVQVCKMVAEGSASPGFDRLRLRLSARLRLRRGPGLRLRRLSCASLIAAIEMLNDGAGSAGSQPRFFA